MFNLGSIMIGTHHPEILARFYEEVFERNADMEGGGWFGWQVGNSFFSISGHSEVKGEAKEPARMMFNLETYEVEEEFERISKIKGATIVQEPYEMGAGLIATIADPDGNYFQLMTPWEVVEIEEKPTRVIN
jgi:predicted enzyme related to lactoylglutathione lyase